MSGFGNSVHGVTKRINGLSSLNRRKSNTLPFYDLPQFTLFCSRKPSSLTHHLFIMSYVELAELSRVEIFMVKVAVALTGVSAISLVSPAAVSRSS